MNTLSFSSVHKSIVRLESIELPPFVVLTGRNGSGKSHLLAAIKAGNIRSSLVGDLNKDVRVFEPTTIIPHDTGIFDPAQEQIRRSQWFTTIQAQRSNHFPSLQTLVMNLGIPAEYCSSLSAIQSLTSASKLKEILPDYRGVEGLALNIMQRVKEYGVAIAGQVTAQIGDDNWRKIIPTVQQRSPEQFLFASESNFYKNEGFLWGEVDPFQQAFGRVFTAYRALIHDNDRLEKYPPKGEDAIHHLNPTEFKEKYGEPPWDFVNQILEASQLDFRVDYPPLHEITSYEPKLTKISSKVEMRFSDLSSGEKVLMSFALCLYNTQEPRQSKVFPKLLLLDEVDAPLHPSMTASLLKTIQDVLVRDKNVAVILTTHSPSTVALAPEESIFSMNPSGPKLEKVSKNSALTLLTTGVPTLSVSFDGRRQVFVESRTDALLYDALYQRYKNQLSYGRSLVFIEVGKKDDKGNETNAGCAQVTRLVNDLADGGNQSVLGLVDWDGHQERKGRIHVLCAGKRNGLESLLLDPVLLIAAVAREKIKFLQDQGIVEQEESYTSLLSWNTDQWQKAVLQIQDFLFGVPWNLESKVEVEYISGMKLTFPKVHLHIDDHALETLVLKKFPFLKQKNQRAGGLMTFVVEIILADNQNFLPKDLLHVFEELLKADVS